ncbi:jg19787 [Pararge aegeria aegeria]|uniref:Jg19787 protein n=1 Tax=Pararge aegeria aegeria TaxID=348720 RepID=A0A8S4SI29_9NEOP|nr:jg19787 [Pararge aegeria aegeria]
MDMDLSKKCYGFSKRLSGPSSKYQRLKRSNKRINDKTKTPHAVVQIWHTLSPLSLSNVSESNVIAWPALQQLLSVTKPFEVPANVNGTACPLFMPQQK